MHFSSKKLYKRFKTCYFVSLYALICACARAFAYTHATDEKDKELKKTKW